MKPVFEDWLPPGRPRRLLDEMDARYRRWAQGLPPGVAALAHRRRAFVSARGDERFNSLADFNPLIACAPWLFWSHFEALDDGRMLLIAEGGARMALASGVIDKLVDGQADPAPEFALLHRALEESAFTLLREAFSGKSPFWAHFERLNEAYAHALALEVHCQHHPAELTLETFVQMSGGKVTPLMIGIAGLAVAAGCAEILEPIERSLRATYVAGQLHDDLLDWEQDAQAGHRTYVLRRLAPPAAWTADRGLAVQELRAANERRWLDVELYRLSLDWYDRAQQAVEGLDCPLWRAYLERYRARAEEDQRRVLARHVARVLEPLLPPG